MLLHQQADVLTFPYDSGEYWMLSDPSVFFKFPVNVRGYFFPFLLLPAHYFATLFKDWMPEIFRLYTSIIYAGFFTILLPSLYVAAFGGKINFFRRMIPSILMVVFFPRLLIYPLSDLPSFILIMCCLSLLLSVKKKLEWTALSILRLIGAGALAYAAYNTRTIYLFTLLCVIGFVPFIIFKVKPIKMKILACLALIFGMGIAASHKV